MRVRHGVGFALGCSVWASLACGDGTGPAKSLGLLAVISAGSLHTCGLTTDGAAYCWGANFAGQLGRGKLSTFESTAAAVAGDFKFSVIDAGSGFTCGLTSDGRAYCWGDNTGARLGIGSLSGSESAPTVPVADGSLRFSSISVGSYACALTAEGAAYCWGGVPGILATGTPIAVAPALQFKQISAGSSVCGLTTLGQTYCRGWADSLPVLVPGGHTFTLISAGVSHTCGLTADGVAYCWGNNRWGQLGIGTFTQSDVAVPTPVAGGLQFTALDLGYVHSCALTSSGAAYCWGSNNTFDLGDPTFGSWSVPRPVVGEHRFLWITTGSGLDHGYSCGVSVDRAGYCWGDNAFGQLGTVSFSQLGTGAGGYVPRRVIGF
jgi:alpha-tubulin suppressor-like RCC1 family protein